MPDDSFARSAWTVSALLAATDDTLAARFGAVAVSGELSGLSRPASGHSYFSLKDADGEAATLRCAMFRRAASLVDFRPADGQQVEVRGRLGVYPPRGELQMVVESMQRVGSGTLYERFVRLRAELQAQGLFDALRKRPIAPFPSAIGVITSLGAAALHDVLTALRRRAPQVRVVVYPTPVQGAEAPSALAAALHRAALRAEVDTLLLVRGGGSLEDLWAFNDERVVRAVAASPIPVVCGVGHETDVTLCDLAADLRAPTPTAAAELCAPARAELALQLARLQAALQRALQRGSQARAQRLDALAMRLSQPGRSTLARSAKLARLRLRLVHALAQRRTSQAEALQQRAGRLQRALAAALERHRSRLASVGQQLHAFDPRSVLQRGYAWVEGGDGRPLVSALALRPGQRVRAVWADGSAHAEVLDVVPATGAR